MLGGVCSDGSKATVEILSLPSGITVLSPREGFSPMELLTQGKDFPSLDDAQGLMMSKMREVFQTLSHTPTETANSIGAVTFSIPQSSLHSFVDSFMEYRWLSPFANSSVVRRLEVRYESAGSGIYLLPPITKVATSQSDEFPGQDGAGRPVIEIALRARLNGDPGTTEMGNSDELKFHITHGPYFGNLYQVRINWQ
jgi:hypothetical protein